nr:FkbM family methyltransferase [Rudaea cellulosilytica]
MLPKRFLASLARWRPGRIARNTAHASTWNLVRVALQALNLMVLTRILGAEGYGSLAGSVALFMTCGQFTGLGSGVAFVRHGVRGGELCGRLAATERAYLLSGLLLFALVWPFSVVLLGAIVPLGALACLAAAEVLIAPALQPLVYRYMAEERIFLSSTIGTLAPVSRLAAAVFALWFGLHDVSSFAQLYVAWIIVITGITLYVAWPRRGDLKSSSSISDTLREGLPYAVSSVALTAGNELDKTILLRLAGDAATGPYAAAYRIVMAATLPVNGLVLAAAPRLFRIADVRTDRLISVMLTAVFVYALVAASLLWLLAPLAPWLFGKGFAHVQPLLHWMCPIVITSCLRQFVTALLTTGDLQKSRNLIEIGGVCISFLLLVLLIPQWGAYGAIIAVACGDLWVISLGTTCIMLKRFLRPSANRISALKKFLRRLVEYRGTGNWIYTERVLAWTSEQAIVDQFNLGMRLFCHYVRLYNRYVGTKTIIFGHGVYKFLQFWNRGGVARLIIRGHPAWLDLEDPGALYAIQELSQGSTLSSLIETLSVNADLFIDVGANQGAFTAIASRRLHAAAEIIAIEPQPKLAECIERTLQETRQGKWRVLQVAVADNATTMKMVVPDENLGEAHLLPANSANMAAALTTPVAMLDELLGTTVAECRAVVKMDIEGAEIAALRGGRRFFNLCKPTLIMEINPIALGRYGHSVADLAQVLSELGYRFWSYCSEPYKYEPLERLPECYCDIVLYAAKAAE